MPGKPSKPEEGIDYIINAEGMLVFTALYHLKRGYCCGQGCINCPYGHQNCPDDRGKREPDDGLPPNTDSL